MTCKTEEVKGQGTFILYMNLFCQRKYVLHVLLVSKLFLFVFKCHIRSREVMFDDALCGKILSFVLLFRNTLVVILLTEEQHQSFHYSLHFIQFV